MPLTKPLRGRSTELKHGIAPTNPLDREKRDSRRVAYLKNTSNAVEILETLASDNPFFFVAEDEDRESYADWFDELEGGGVASHELLPVVFPPKRAGLGPRMDAKKKKSD